MPRKTSRVLTVTPELWQEVDTDNKKLMDDFLEYLRSTDKSPGTIKQYTSDLKIFFCWNLKNNKNKYFVDFSKRDMLRYQNWILNDLKLSSNRIRGLRSALSSMSDYIEKMLDDEYPDFRNIINKIPAPVRQEVRDKTILTEEQVQYLLDYLVERKKYQQACVFALAIASGARKAELLRFKVSHFSDENIIYGALYKTPEKIKTKGRGSLGKMIPKYVLVNKFKPYFDLWMEERKQLGLGDNDILFWKKEKDTFIPAKISTLNSYSLTFSKILGIDFYFHSNRHYFTTALCKANIPADVIKDIVGWSSVAMVSLYNDSEIDEELEKYFSSQGIIKQDVKTMNDL
jgi:integrase